MEHMNSIYLTEENVDAVAADTEWTREQLLSIVKYDTRRWRICISGIRAEDD